MEGDAADKGAHDVKAGDAEAGSVHVQNDFSGISDDYLLDVEFSCDSCEMGSGSNAGCHVLVSKNPVPNASAFKTDSLQISCPSEARDHAADYHDNFLHCKDPELHAIPQHSYDCEIPADDKWSNFSTSFALHDLDKLEDVSGHLTDNLYYDKDNSNMFLYYDFSDEGTSSPSTLKQYGQSTQAGQIVATECLCTNNALPQKSTQPTSDGLLKDTVSTDHLCYDNVNSETFLYYDFSESEGTSSPSTLNQYGESLQASQNFGTESLCIDSLAQESTQPSSVDDVPMKQKRLRKPTRRYIDESADMSSISFMKRKVPTSTSKGKVLRDKREKDKGTVALMVNLVPEEFVLKPIQVPFGSLVGCKHSKVRAPFELAVLNSDDESEDKNTKNCITKLRFKEIEGQKESDCIEKVRQKHNGGWRDGSFIQEAHSKEDDDGRRECHGSMNVCSKENSAQKIGDRIRKVRQERDGCQKVSDRIMKMRFKVEDSKGPRDYIRKVRPEEKSRSGSAVKCKEDGKRKHHRLWTIAEIKKLIEGVSQHGVGRWTDIKRLYFSTSDHRTSVDLKDKWRNLLKASRLQKQNKIEGCNKRNLAWRPLPNTILSRVNDLATIYPYPRARNPSSC
ncbi:hypothetical protein LIER_30627 [Lithospermum erythrorhizon]|uniref:Uncharacterized protein n=1 Tax=Lithospermum erythrorhizon TaxID=34254 RepID=A0AAV3RS02_LITER